MPDYPKTTGECVTVKDPADGQAKLLDTLIQLLRAADTSTLDSLNNLINSFNTLNGAAWKNNQTNLPATDNSYDIGSNTQMIKSIFTHGLQIGEEGEDWWIGDNSGYITLPSGMAMQWKKESGKNTSRHTFTFPKSLQASIVYIGATVQVTSPSGSLSSVEYCLSWTDDDAEGYASEDHTLFLVGY